MVGVGAWSLYEFGAYEAISSSVPYAASSKLIIAAGVFNVLASYFGFWVTPKDSKPLLALVSLPLLLFLEHSVKCFPVLKFLVFVTIAPCTLRCSPGSPGQRAKARRAWSLSESLAQARQKLEFKRNSNDNLPRRDLASDASYAMILRVRCCDRIEVFCLTF